MIWAVKAPPVAALVNSTRTSKPSTTTRSTTARSTPVDPAVPSAAATAILGVRPTRMSCGRTREPFNVETAPKKDITKAFAGAS
ncbi:Uncharacterised protein [Mycobacterium tuberculosis]|nr:Uncharacterised protein [Mycobacterium tuberculosis]CNL61960.1 Uncharacterised protein [Mycobacterium tuberculosis]CNU30231.1 Uncharacterised protein [Mycobacterium tuberculosis]CNW71703.1 Uncharacterised protein [Mycobacterium tuberculosis]CNY82288.1 Uncharacterised protein [Mycobacterium tuberculosis]